jgi:hypothetical protein
MTPKQMVAKRMVEISGGQLTDCYAEIAEQQGRIAELEAVLREIASSDDMYEPASWAIHSARDAMKPK